MTKTSQLELKICIDVNWANPILYRKMQPLNIVNMWVLKLTCRPTLFGAFIVHHRLHTTPEPIFCCRLYWRYCNAERWSDSKLINLSNSVGRWVVQQHQCRIMLRYLVWLNWLDGNIKTLHVCSWKMYVAMTGTIASSLMFVKWNLLWHSTVWSYRGVVRLPKHGLTMVSIIAEHVLNYFDIN